MPHVPDTDSITPEERLRSIARILAKGLLRLKPAASSRPTPIPQIPLQFRRLRLKLPPGNCSLSVSVNPLERRRP